ncbi:MAG: hypothetical protein ACYTF6_01910 [Planctomycetota bacterium]|jgi:hypothetical protein
MATVRRALFEGSPYLYVVLVLAEIVLTIRWRQLKTRVSALVLAVPVAAAACVFALDYLVVTDREQIIAVCEEMARDVEAGSVNAAEKYLDESFNGDFGNKRMVLAEVRRLITRYKPRRIRLKSMQVTVAGRRAEMFVIVVAEPGAGMLAGGPVSQSLRLHWVKLEVENRRMWRIRTASRHDSTGG